VAEHIRDPETGLLNEHYFDAALPNRVATARRVLHPVSVAVIAVGDGASPTDVAAALLDALRDAGVDVPVVVGGIIPEADVEPLKAAGVAAVYTPKDFELDRIMHDIVALVATRNGVAAAA